MLKRTRLVTVNSKVPRYAFWAVLDVATWKGRRAVSYDLMSFGQYSSNNYTHDSLSHNRSHFFFSPFVHREFVRIMVVVEYAWYVRWGVAEALGPGAEAFKTLVKLGPILHQSLLALSAVLRLHQ